MGVYRKPSNYANGLTRDRQGRLIACEHGSRRVTRTEYDGSITVLIDKFDGKRLNSPNDVVVKSDDSIWFTDPLFGIRSNYVGNLGTQELPTNVYRLHKNGQATIVAGDITQPNGLVLPRRNEAVYPLECNTAGDPCLRCGRGRQQLPTPAPSSPARAKTVLTASASCGRQPVVWLGAGRAARRGDDLQFRWRCIANRLPRAVPISASGPSATASSWPRCVAVLALCEHQARQGLTRPRLVADDKSYQSRRSVRHRRVKLLP